MIRARRREWNAHPLSGRTSTRRWEGGEIVPGEREHGPLGYSSSIRDRLHVLLTGFAIQETRKTGMVVDCEQFTSYALDRYWAEKSTDQVAVAQPRVTIELEREWA